jgi:hypothetical protein
LRRSAYFFSTSMATKEIAKHWKKKRERSSNSFRFQ